MVICVIGRLDTLYGGLPLIKGLADDGAVQHWLGRYEVDWRYCKLSVFSGFYEWLQSDPRFKGLTPAQLVEFQKGAARNGEECVLLDRLEDYIQQKKGTYRTLLKNYTTVRAFFKKNRATLPEDDFQINADRDPVRGRLTVDVIRNLVNVADLGMKAFYLTVWMGLLDLERFAILNFKKSSALVQHLDEHGVDTPFMLEYPGRKWTKGKTLYYTFIGQDALNAWKNYIDHERGVPKEGEPLLTCSTEKSNMKDALRLKHLRLLESMKYITRGGSVANRYGLHLHEFRDTAKTYLHIEAKKDGLDMDCIKFWMGHITDPNQYDKFNENRPYVLGQYRIAEKYLNIITGTQTLAKPSVEDLKQLLFKDPETRKDLTNLIMEMNELKNMVDEALEKRLRQKVMPIISKREPSN